MERNRYRYGEDQGRGRLERPERLAVREHIVRRMRELIKGSFMAGVVDIPEEGKRSVIGDEPIWLTPEDIESASVGCGDLLATFVLANISQSWAGWETPQDADRGIYGILSTALDDIESLRDMAGEWADECDVADGRDAEDQETEGGAQ